MELASGEASVAPRGTCASPGKEHAMRVALNGDSYSRANSYTLDFRRKAMLRATLFLASVLAVACSGTGRICPTWQYLSNGTGQCECGSSLQDVVVCNKTQGTVGVMVGYCLTSDGNSSVVGHCLAEYINQEKLLGETTRKFISTSLSRRDTHVVFSTERGYSVVSASLKHPYMPTRTI